jgi:hypothetical protein
MAISALLLIIRFILAVCPRSYCDAIEFVTELQAVLAAGSDFKA